MLFFFDTATWSTMGPDNEFSFVFIGADNTWGTPDDDRGDDENLFWFRMDLNDPFFIDAFPPPPVDASTYSRNLANLPMGDNYAANGSPAVANELGYPNTRAVMYEQTGPQSEFRSLSRPRSCS